jgi:sugar phosphate isomerase/epimerase
MKPFITSLAACLAITTLAAQDSLPRSPTDVAGQPGLFDRQNLTAWCVVPFDSRKRGPEERAEMLQRLGFKSFAYDWRPKDVPTFDAEVEALNKHGINLVAWWFPTDAGDPSARTILEVVKRHGIQPQLWVMGSGSSTKTEAEQVQRTDQEAERIRKIVELAAPYGCKVELYNHNGWFGQPDNEVAVIERLKQKGVGGVGMVYNFSHGHGDIADFPAIWKRIEHYVVAVNVTGMVMNGRIIPPSQGDKELEMMRTIQQSGWHGPIGLIAEQGGDAEVTLGNNLRGLDWLKKELAHPGSGGERPRFIAAGSDTK